MYLYMVIKITFKVIILYGAGLHLQSTGEVKGFGDKSIFK